ncbi:hypothetical protein FQA39_LY10670 [Lamprigera yunnana]|nr:hypothetical protein FQA39_LY10670 [Lamprigera yunnana]
MEFVEEMFIQHVFILAWKKQRNLYLATYYKQKIMNLLMRMIYHSVNLKRFRKNDESEAVTNETITLLQEIQLDQYTVTDVVEWNMDSQSLNEEELNIKEDEDDQIVDVVRKIPH